MRLSFDSSPVSRVHSRCAAGLSSGGHSGKAGCQPACGLPGHSRGIRNGPGRIERKRMTWRRNPEQYRSSLVRSSEEKSVLRATEDPYRLLCPNSPVPKLHKTAEFCAIPLAKRTASLRSLAEGEELGSNLLRVDQRSCKQWSERTRGKSPDVGSRPMRAQPIACLSAPELPPQIDASLPAPSWQRHLRHDPTVETLRDRGLRFAATAQTLD
jgi:hypothetical protein